MNKSESISALAASLAKAQGEIKLPEKNREVTVQTRTGGQYTFAYADLAAIHNVIQGPLSKNGLCYTHIINNDDSGHYLLTMLIHSSGEWISSRYPLPTSGDSKALGGEITYGKRYSLCGLTGVVADDDNDVEPQNLKEQPRDRQLQKPPMVQPQPTGRNTAPAIRTVTPPKQMAQPVQNDFKNMTEDQFLI